MNEGHHIHGLSPAQVVALKDECETLREALRAQQRVMRPNVVTPAAWRLMPGEADVLMAIRAASPDIATRDRIFVAVYGALNDDLPDESIIYQRVAHIRRKLRQAGVAATIETIPARGYRMDLESAECLDRAIADNRRSPWVPDAHHHVAAE